MSETVEPHLPGPGTGPEMGPGTGPEAGPGTGPETGVETVDGVVASLDGLDGLPVAEHVAVFERAHESLRQALAEA